MPPRVAFFTDSFHEVNGVAHTSRNFTAFAQRHHLPFLSVRAGTAPPTSTPDDFHTLELPRSRLAVPLEKDLFFDPLFVRHTRAIDQALRRFRPDILHITGPSELGIAAAYFAWSHRIPLAASWHTNVHEYAGRRLQWLTRILPAPAAHAIEQATEDLALNATTRFYRLARVLFAPNPDLCRLLEHKCHRPCYLMQRGVDTTLFSPMHRTRPSDPTDIRIGFVGRLSVEKNVLLLPHIERALRDRGITNTRFVIIGHGALEPTLRAALPTALFPGVLRGHALAQAYADLDLFLFPSHTDTFGNVILEALASGIPALVTPSGGPRHILEQAAATGPEVGLICEDDNFAPDLATLLADPDRLARMRVAARAYALRCSWDAVFAQVYAGYDLALAPSNTSRCPDISPHNPPV